MVGEFLYVFEVDGFCCLDEKWVKVLGVVTSVTETTEKKFCNVLEVGSI